MKAKDHTHLLSEDAPHEVRDELRVGGVLVVQLAGHLHHLAPLPFPDGQEVCRPAVVHRPDAVE